MILPDLAGREAARGGALKVGSTANRECGKRPSTEAALPIPLFERGASIDNALYAIRSVNKIGAEPCEQLLLLFGLSFRAEYCAFGGLIAQPLQMRLHVPNGIPTTYLGGCKPGELAQFSKCMAVSVWRNFFISSSRSGPGFILLIWSRTPAAHSAIRS